MNVPNAAVLALAVVFRSTMEDELVKLTVGVAPKAGVLPSTKLIPWTVELKEVLALRVNCALVVPLAL